MRAAASTGGFGMHSMKALGGVSLNFKSVGVKNRVVAGSAAAVPFFIRPTRLERTGF